MTEIPSENDEAWGGLPPDPGPHVVRECPYCGWRHVLPESEKPHWERFDWSMEFDRYEQTPDGLHLSFEWYGFGDAVTVTAMDRAPFARIDEWVYTRAATEAREQGAMEHNHMFVTVKDHNGAVVFQEEFWMGGNNQ